MKLSLFDPHELKALPVGSYDSTAHKLHMSRNDWDRNFGTVGIFCVNSEGSHTKLYLAHHFEGETATTNLTLNKSTVSVQ